MKRNSQYINLDTFPDDKITTNGTVEDYIRKYPVSVCSVCGRTRRTACQVWGQNRLRLSLLCNLVYIFNWRHKFVLIISRKYNLLDMYEEI